LDVRAEVRNGIVTIVASECGHGGGNARGGGIGFPQLIGDGIALALQGRVVGQPLFVLLVFCDRSGSIW
jgi:hypothetical protein